MPDTRAYERSGAVSRVTARKVVDIRGQRAERKRQEILRAGLKVFSEKGFRAATMDDIALELEATKGLLYHHFNTKDDLLRAILAENNLAGGIDLLVADVRKRPMREALVTVVRTVLGTMAQQRELIRFLHAHTLLSTKGAELVYSSVIDRLHQGLVSLVDGWRQQRAIRSDVDTKAVARAISDCLLMYLLSIQTFGPTHDLGPRYGEQLVELMLHGLVPTAREKKRSRRRPATKRKPRR